MGGGSVLLNEMSLMSTALELFAAVVTAVMLIGCFMERKYTDKVGKLLRGVLAAHFAMLVCDAPIWLLLDQPSPDSVPLVKILSFLSNALMCATITLYTYFLTEYIARREKISDCYARIVACGCLLETILYLISSFNGMFIGYDANGQDVTGPLYLVSQIFFVVMPTISVVLAVKHHRAIGRQSTIVMVLYGIIPVLSIPLQYYWAITPVYLASTLSQVLVYTLIHVEQVQRAADNENKLIRQDLELSESRNAIVLSQIQPHFLYNALTSIYCLCDSKPELAKQAVSEFATYLRGNLDSLKQRSVISFQEELKHIQAYLSLEKIRYDDDLEIRYDIQASNFFLPALTVQPLVENAVNHGVSDLPDGGWVQITTRETECDYVISVTDNGAGFDTNAALSDGRSHVGIANVRSRLVIMCHGTLEIISSPGNGTTATVRIPKGEA